MPPHITVQRSCIHILSSEAIPWTATATFVGSKDVEMDISAGSETAGGATESACDETGTGAADEPDAIEAEADSAGAEIGTGAET
jgi:hypothetical protein